MNAKLRWLGWPHNDVMKAIRKMEPAWKKISEGNFSRAEYKDIKKKIKKFRWEVRMRLAFLQRGVGVV